MNYITKLEFLAILIFFGAIQGFAQPYTNDTTFNPNYNFSKPYLPARNGSVANIIELIDGSILVGGAFNNLTSGIAHKTIIKLNNLGIIDTTFYFGGWYDGLYNFQIYDDYVYMITNVGIGKRYIQNGGPVMEFYNNKDSSNWLGSYTDIHVFENGFYDTSFYHSSNYPNT